jgi:GT2 family glycosyltransferase
MRMSAVVPTRGNSAALERCIQSLKIQTKKIDEIIVVSPNNDSARGTAKKHDCKWVEDKKNTIGNAYCAGAKAAKGNLVFFIDDDCTAPRNWTSSLAADVESENLDVVGEVSKCSFYDRQGTYRKDGIIRKTGMQKAEGVQYSLQEKHIFKT